MSSGEVFKADICTTLLLFAWETLTCTYPPAIASCFNALGIHACSKPS